MLSSPFPFGNLQKKNCYRINVVYMYVIFASIIFYLKCITNGIYLIDVHDSFTNREIISSFKIRFQYFFDLREI